MATKFYLRNAAQSGTLPGSQTMSNTFNPPTVNLLGTNGGKSLSTSIGSSQTSIAFTTQAVTSPQATAIGSWISPPLAAQTIVAQKINFSLGASESNASSDFIPSMVVALWRPSTTTVIGRFYDMEDQGLEAGTSESSITCNPLAISPGPFSALDGDVIVCEMWRDQTIQGMASAYTNTIFYDGTTEASTTSNAAFINFLTSTLTFYTPPAAGPPYPIRNINKTALNRASRW